MSTKQLILNAALVPAFFLAACQKKEPAPVAEKEPPPAESASAAAQPKAARQPADEMASYDHRKPVPLMPMMAWHQKENMMQHLVAIQRITDALSHEDWKQVASASALIESSPQMQQMCEHMGAGAEGFTEMAVDFHKRADQIAVSAREHDSAGVLRAVSNTLQACTECHATYRQELVDAATFEARTGQAHEPGMMHGEK